MTDARPREDDQPDAADEALLRAEYAYRGRLLKLRVDHIRMADGRETTREIVEHPGAVAVVPLLPDGRAILIRQLTFSEHVLAHATQRGDQGSGRIGRPEGAARLPEGCRLGGPPRDGRPLQVSPKRLPPALLRSIAMLRPRPRLPCPPR